MRASIPKLVALGFHDGPTEGFLRGVVNGNAHYFKVVAWDDLQDRRLYLLGQLKEHVVDEFLSLVAAPDRTALSAVFVPNWTFGNTVLEARAEELVKAGRSTLSSPDLVVLGSSLLEGFEVVNPTESQLRWAKAFAQSPSPGRLADWLALSQ